MPILWLLACDSVGGAVFGETGTAPVSESDTTGTTDTPTPPQLQETADPTDPSPTETDPPDTTLGTADTTETGLPSDTGVGSSCVTWAPIPELLGTLAAPDVQEASGLVISSKNAGVMWIHDDRNDDPDDRARVFALGIDGADLGTYWLDGVENYDFEAMTTGIGNDGKPWLYIGDVGDNDRERLDVAIVGFPEPTVNVALGDPGDQYIVGAEVYRATWPTVPPSNCEAVGMDPRTGDFWLLTKSGQGFATLNRYPMPFRVDETVELEELLDVTYYGPPNPALTDMAFSQDGSIVVARTYTQTLSWVRGPDDDVVEALSREPCVGELPAQNLGETIAFDIDGRSLFTVSEGAGAAVLRLAME